MTVNGLKIINADNLKAAIGNIKYVKRKPTGEIPYGYKPCQFNRGLLEVIPEQMFALHVALAKLHEGMSLRSVARWLSITGKRKITHAGLRKYFLQDQMKLLERINVLEDKAREIFEEIGPTKLKNGRYHTRRNTKDVPPREDSTEETEPSISEASEADAGSVETQTTH